MVLRRIVAVLGVAFGIGVMSVSDTTATGSPSIRAACSIIQKESVLRKARPYLVEPMTEPIYRMPSLLGVSVDDASSEQLIEAHDDELRLRKTHIRSRVVLPDDSQGCTFEYVDSNVSPEYQLTHTQVAVSSAIRNPYVTGSSDEYGVFLSISIGGVQERQWFWVVLDDELLSIVKIVPLPIEE